MTERLRLLPGVDVVLRAHGDGWLAGPERPDEAPCVAGDGAAEALLRLLGERTALPDGWDLLRLAPAPLAEGERAIEVDQTNRSLVVGEAVVVKWQRRIADRPHSALAAAEPSSPRSGSSRRPRRTRPDLDEPARSRAARGGSDRATFPGRVTAGTWCAELVRRRASGDRSDPWVDRPAGAARRRSPRSCIARSRHRTMSSPTRSSQPAPAASSVWHDGAFALLEEALSGRTRRRRRSWSLGPSAIAGGFSDALADSAASWPAHRSSHPWRPARRPDPALVGGHGLAVVDFDGNPVVDADSAAGLLHPAARDVAQLIRSLDHVGQVVLQRSPEPDPGAVREWMAGAREEFLDRLSKDACRRRACAPCSTSGCCRPSSWSRSSASWSTPPATFRSWAYAPLAACGTCSPDDGRPTLWSRAGPGSVSIGPQA